MRFASGQIVTKTYRNSDHVYPPAGLFFRLGKAEEDSYTFNGVFYGSEFKYTG